MGDRPNDCWAMASAGPNSWTLNQHRQMPDGRTFTNPNLIYAAGRSISLRTRPLSRFQTRTTWTTRKAKTRQSQPQSYPRRPLKSLPRRQCLGRRRAASSRRLRPLITVSSREHCHRCLPYPSIWWVARQRRSLPPDCSSSSSETGTGAMAVAVTKVGNVDLPE